MANKRYALADAPFSLFWWPSGDIDDTKLFFGRNGISIQRIRDYRDNSVI